MTRIGLLFAALLALALPGEALAQCNGQFLAGQACANAGASQAPPGPATMSALLDRNFGAPSGVGTMLNRGMTLWSATTTPQLGASGTLGSITFGNATSGLVTLQPVTGALGTVTALLPANSGTIAEINLAQTWTAGQVYGSATGGNQGVGTINATGLFVNGVAVSTTNPGGANGNVQYNNAGVFGGLTNTQLTADINLATASVSGAIPAFPNNTTTFLRGDLSYATLNFAAVSSTLGCGQLPALTGDVTNSSCATTVAKIQGTTVSGVTGSVNVVFSTSPTLVTPVLGVAKSTTLTAGDGCTTDRSGGSQIWVCRALSASTNSHAFSSSDTITWTVGSLGHAVYDDQTIYQANSTIAPNHSYTIQGFPTWAGTGAGNLSVLGFANWAPQSTGGHANLVVFSNITDIALSGGATVDTQYGYSCVNGLAAATTNRCFISSANTPVEFRGHIITHVLSPTLSSCGTSPSIEGSDTAGEVTMGTGSPTGCVITFRSATYGAYVSAPMCTVTWQSNLATMQYTISASAITLTQTATSSNKVDYICIAQAGG